MVKICNCRRDRKLSQCRVTSSPYSALLSATILWGSRAPTADRWAEGANLWIAHAFWPTSPRPWTRNCFCATNTWLPKIGILKAQLQGRLRLSDTGRVTLGEIGHRLGRKALGDVATAALPDTILGRTESSSPANSMDRAHVEPRAGRRSAKKSRKLIIRMAKENRSCGYDRIVGALANLGHQVSDQTVGNVLRRHGIPSAPERRRTSTWAEFIRAHLAVLAGTDFFTVEVLTLRGLATYYILFFIHLESRKVEIAGITTHPIEQWMTQMARNVTMQGSGPLETAAISFTIATRSTQLPSRQSLSRST
jgi:hypothetical protein